MCVSITPNQLVLATQDSSCLPPEVSPEQRAITATAADDIWAPEQMGKFLDHIATHRLGGCFALTLLGLRREEVGGLRWSDIDPHTGALHICRARVDVNWRHSNISRMRAAGIAADVVAAWHGHTERMTQAVYGRVTDSRLTTAADVFSSGVGQS